MRRIETLAVLAPALLLLACGGQAGQSGHPGTSNEISDPGEANSTPPEPSPASSAPANGTDVADDGKPDPTPPTLTPEAERSETGARSVLLSFARAIELKEFGQAWAMLSPADQRRWSRTQFAAMFADLGTITVAVPTGTIEGAAGSSYYTAPVTITANDRDGRPIRYEGQAVLRRVNDVDGATPAQLRWHFEKLTLDWTH